MPDRRTALLRSARVAVGESGTEGAALVHPELATTLAEALVEDMGEAIERSTRGIATLEELVEALVDAVLECAGTWQDGLALANAAIERMGAYEAWSELMAPWVEAIERAVADAQRRGLVRDDVDAATVALVLRDALDRTAKAAIIFGRQRYRETAAMLVRGALRA
jgi:hypothetical protein